MTASAVTALVAIGVLAILCAALLHAIVAAFEQLPYADERRMAGATRPDGRPTSAAKLAAAGANTANAASVASAIAEAAALVCLTLLVVETVESLGWPGWVVLLVAVALAAFTSLLLIRALPRLLGRTHPEATVRATAPLVRLLIFLTTPVRVVVPTLRAPELAEPEDLVDRAHETLEEEDVDLLRGVVNLGETLAREVMVPRTDMVTIESGTPVRKAMVLFMRSGFSRVPVVAGGVDESVGVVYLKDVVKATWDHVERLDEPVDVFMREPVFVPESLAVDDLLRRMQTEVFHIAIVVDEYGGVAGLVTIEDALEEIVGELTDEHDAAEPEVEQLDADEYRVPARYPLDDLAELFEVEIDDTDVDTVAGLLAKALGRVPIPGATASAHGLQLTAERYEGRRRRLTSVLVRREEAPDE